AGAHYPPADATGELAAAAHVGSPGRTRTPGRPRPRTGRRPPTRTPAQARRPPRTRAGQCRTAREGWCSCASAGGLPGAAGGWARARAGPAYQAQLAAGQRPTGAALARAAGVSERYGQRLLAEFTAAPDRTGHPN